MVQVLLLLKPIHHSMTNEGQREKNIWLYITPNESSDMTGKMTLEGHFKEKDTIWKITPESISDLLVILDDKGK
jgi:hypothetical protein